MGQPQPLTHVLPEFPWDQIAPLKEQAAAHPGGLVNLTMGEPVDPTPTVVREALAAAADAHGYPTTVGTLELRQAAANWFARARNVPGVGVDAVIPTTGSKEVVAWLPTWLGLGAGDAVAFPDVAYPTYGVGAGLAGAASVTYRPGDLPTGDGIRLVWVNSPGNPTSRVADVAELRELVQWARRHDVIVASDECYALLPWTDDPVPSVLDPQVCDGDHTGLLVVHSLSKQSSMAGYRAGLLAGDQALIAPLLEVRKHSGMIVPYPVQAAITAALDDDVHTAVVREAYLRRLAVLQPAVAAVGFVTEACSAGLYLWVTRGEDCWASARWFADRGVAVTPGEIYGAAGAKYVRVALTATDQTIADAARRLLEDA